MNREQAELLVGKQHLIEAIAEGKTIQHNGFRNRWEDLHDPVFNAPIESYRIKPEPREFWISIDQDGYAKGVFSSDPHQIGREAIHVREVLDDE